MQNAGSVKYAEVAAGGCLSGVHFVLLQSYKAEGVI
jgi:hypothetical protein